jgi:hypothetical protein
MVDGSNPSGRTNLFPSPTAAKRLCGENLAQPRQPLPPLRNSLGPTCASRRKTMNGVIYLVGLVVVVLAILSFFGLR